MKVFQYNSQMSPRGLGDRCNKKETPVEFLDRRTIYDGEYVFKEGEEGDRAYILQDGTVEIFQSRDGEEIVLGELSKGGIFGEMALIDDKPRMASARAVGTCTVIIIPRRTFAEKLKEADPFIRALLTLFVRTIRGITHEKTQFTTRPVEEEIEI